MMGSKVVCYWNFLKNCFLKKKKKSKKYKNQKIFFVLEKPLLRMCLNAFARVCAAVTLLEAVVSSEGTRILS